MWWDVAISFMVLAFIGGSDDVACQSCSLQPNAQVSRTVPCLPGTQPGKVQGSGYSVYRCANGGTRRRLIDEGVKRDGDVKRGWRVGRFGSWAMRLGIWKRMRMHGRKINAIAFLGFEEKYKPICEEKRTSTISAGLHSSSQGSLAKHT